MLVGNLRKFNSDATTGVTKGQNVSDKGALAVFKLREAYALNQKSPLGSPQKSLDKAQKSSPSQRTLQSFNFSTVQICANKTSQVCDNEKEPGTPNFSDGVTYVNTDCDSGKGTISSPDSEVGLSTPDISSNPTSESPKSSPETLVKMEKMESFSASDPHLHLERDQPVREQEINHHSSPICKRMKMEAKDTFETEKLPTDSIDAPVTVMKRKVPLNFSMRLLAKRMEQLKQQCQKNESEMFRRFRAKISPGENKAAEDELQKEIR